MCPAAQKVSVKEDLKMSVPNTQMTAMLNQSSNQAAAAAAAAGVPQLVKNYYAYNLYFPTVNDGAQASANTQVQADAAFLVQAMSAWIWDLTDLVVVPITDAYTIIQITLQASGTTFFDQPIPISNAFGTGQFPFILPNARILPANSVVSGSLNNVASLTPTNPQLYYLTLHGKKLFNYN